MSRLYKKDIQKRKRERSKKEREPILYLERRYRTAVDTGVFMISKIFNEGIFSKEDIKELNENVQSFMLCIHPLIVEEDRDEYERKLKKFEKKTEDIILLKNRFC